MSPIKVFVFRIKCCLATFLWVFFRFHKNYHTLVYEMRQWEKVLGTVHYKSDFLCFIRMSPDSANIEACCSSGWEMPA